MNTYNQQRWEELLALFIDGVATEAEKKELFDTLALNPSLRGKFDHARSVEKALHLHSKSSTPMDSESKKRALFARLDMKPPVAMQSTAVASKTQGVPLLSSLAFVFLTAVIALLLLYRFAPEQQEVATTGSAEQATTLFPDNVAIADIANEPLVPPILPPSSSIVAQNAMPVSAVIPDTVLPLEEVVDTRPFSQYAQIEDRQWQPQTKEILPPDFLLWEASAPRQWHISAYGRVLQGIAVAPARPFSNTILPIGSNVAAGIRFHLDYNHAIGLEIGQEGQPLLVQEEDGPELFEMMNWYSLSYRYTIGSPSDWRLRPFLEVQSGVSRSGMVSRFAIGGSYAASENITLWGSVEASNLFYRDFHGIENTQRVGISIGAEFILFR